MRQVFGEWGVVTETKRRLTVYYPHPSTIRGISHIVSEPAERGFFPIRRTLRFVKRFLTGSRECFRHTFYHNWRYPFLRIKQADIRIRKSFPGFIKKG